MWQPAARINIWFCDPAEQTFRLLISFAARSAANCDLGLVTPNGVAELLSNSYLPLEDETLCARARSAVEIRSDLCFLCCSAVHVIKLSAHQIRALRRLSVALWNVTGLGADA